MKCDIEGCPNLAHPHGLLCGTHRKLSVSPFPSEERKAPEVERTPGCVHCERGEKHLLCNVWPEGERAPEPRSCGAHNFSSPAHDLCPICYPTQPPMNKYPRATTYMPSDEAFAALRVQAGEPERVSDFEAALRETPDRPFFAVEPEPGRAGEREPRELLCGQCGSEHVPWYADNALWNKTVRRPDGSDEEPFLCASCFMRLAVSRGVADLFRVSLPVPADSVEYERRKVAFVEATLAVNAGVALAGTGDDAERALDDWVLPALADRERREEELREAFDAGRRSASDMPSGEWDSVAFSDWLARRALGGSND